MGFRNLNLTKGFNPFEDGNDIQHSLSFFSGGEPNFRITDENFLFSNVRVSIRLKTANDLFVLCCAVDALRRINSKVNISLFTPYIPAARQDRVCRFGESLTSKVYADIINSLNFDNVNILDPHSDVSTALINNCHPISSELFLREIPVEQGVVVIPDFGATKKIEKFCEGRQIPIQAYKKRDINGKLIDFGVFHDDFKSEDIFILDDICDGGGTFIGLAEKLREKNCGKINLCVTHGIFSKGIGHLLNHVNKIYTTDSWSGYENELDSFSGSLEVIKIKL